MKSIQLISIFNVILFISAIVSCASVSDKKSPIPTENQDQPIFVNSLDTWDSLDVKADWFMKNLAPNRDLGKIPTDFIEFYEQFISDSLFQLEHIAFEEIIGVDSYCDTTIYITKDNWKFNNWDFTEFFDSENNIDEIDGWDNTFYFNDERFYYQFRLKEIGWIYKTGFEKLNGKWQLTFYFRGNC